MFHLDNNNMEIFIIPILILLVTAIYQKYTNGVCKSQKKLGGKVTIVTGGTAGMGLEIARDFAKRGARVIIASPFEEEGTCAQETIVRSTGNNHVIFKKLDLGSLDSVRKFASDILKNENRLDILVNNAGVGTVRDFITPDGMSFIMQVNYFGHFLLTLLLLPLLKKTGNSLEPSRVVNTSSVSHIFGAFGINELNKIDYIKLQTYSRSKFCLVMFTQELSKILKAENVVVNSIDPGAVGTTIFYSTGKLVGSVLRFLSNACFKTPQQGAQTALHVALDAEAGTVSGEIFKNCKRSRAVHWAYDDILSKNIWRESVRLVKLKESELENCFNSM